ncbi:TPA: MptD family putative ECF transporter S component [Streptococcus pyogenes]
MKDKKLNVRDLINAGLFAVLIFIATFVGGIIGFMPTLMPVVPLLQGIISGPVYMLYSTKIKKTGMVFIQTTVMSLAFFAMGHGPWVVLTGVIAGILAEMVLKKGNYTSVKQARFAFVVQSLWGLGNWLPIFFARDSYIKTMIDMGYGEEYAQKMMSVLPNWSLIPIILLGMIGTYIGCSIGIKMLRKHFVKAGMAEV